MSDDDRETLSLLDEAIEAVNALSVHLRDTGNDEQMYKANAALHMLWNISPPPRSLNQVSSKGIESPLE